MKKIVAFIVARLTSTRMPNKHFRHIGNKPLIKWTTDQLKQSRLINNIVIATVDCPENKPLQEFAKQEEINCFFYQGDINDVVGRLTTAAIQFDAEVCILISGDCPLIYAPSLDRQIEALLHTDKLCAAFDNNTPSIYQGILVSYRSAWETADKLSDRYELREHLFPVITTDPVRFPTVMVTDSGLIQQIGTHSSFNHKLSVDTPADLDFMNQVYRRLQQNGQQFELPDVINLLQNEPNLLEINRDVKTKDLLAKSKKILFGVTTGAEFGYSNLLRSLHLGELITRNGHGAHFFVPVGKVKEFVENRGFQCTVDPDFGKSVWDQYDALVFDINPQLEITEDIQNHVIFIDNTRGFASHANRIIITNNYYTGRKFDNLTTGLTIIRTPIKQQLEKSLTKDINILSYQPYSSKPIKDYGKTVVIDQLTDDFPELLARAKFYIAPFDYTFYEAVYLKTIPVVSENSNARQRDEAAKFYHSLDLPFVEESDFRKIDLPDIHDNSDAIVALIIG